METYQIDALISEDGVIKLSEMPYLYNKRVKLIIISSDDNDTKLEQRKQAFERIVKRREAQPTGHWTDEERNNARYEYLKEKHL